jgi:hypothetical protein
MLSRIANSIVAENQRRLFAKLLQQNLSYFAEHHSSEFIARLTTGAGAASQVLNLLINSVGRDLLTLIALLVVMVVQDPVMSVLTLVVGPPMVLLMRKLVQRIRAVAFNRWTGGTCGRDDAGVIAGHPHRQGVHTRRHDACAFRRQRRRCRTRVEQNGPHRAACDAAYGGARRHRRVPWDDVRRLSRDRYRCHARRIHVVHDRVPARL